jgi:hypothetical protein
MGAYRLGHLSMLVTDVDTDVLVAVNQATHRNPLDEWPVVYVLMLRNRLDTTFVDPYSPWPFLGAWYASCPDRLDVDIHEISSSRCGPGLTRT